MTDNVKSYEVILLDHYEQDADKNGAYLSLFNVDGKSYRIGEKRQHLWGIKNLPQFTPIILTFETYQKNGETISFVSDAKKLESDDISKSAIQGTLKRLLMSSENDRYRSQALAYAKDIEVAYINSSDKTGNSEDILDRATTFFYFIKGQQETKEEIVEE